MAKSDLLKEAIADAKAVKETALANAKVALQEAFAPRMKSMLENELMNELEDEELEGGMEMEMEPGMDDMEGDMAMEPGMDDMEGEMDGEPMDVGDIEIDTDMDGEIDFTGDIMSKPGMDDMDVEPGMDADMGMEPGMGDEEDLGLEEIIRELEEDLEADDSGEAGIYGEGDYTEGQDDMIPENYTEEDNGLDAGQVLESTNQSIDELIEAILAEEEADDAQDDKCEDCGKSKVAEGKKGGCGCNESESKAVKEELDEAYRTVGHLKSVINEVNLLNAKLLYTNKLFRNFELNESQKMKVIENFDRAANTREAKLVFSTLAESFKKPSRGKRKVVKESRSLASKPVATTAPRKETTQVLTEGFEQANRWKKLAGLIK